MKHERSVCAWNKDVPSDSSDDPAPEGGAQTQAEEPPHEQVFDGDHNAVDLADDTPPQAPIPTADGPVSTAEALRGRILDAAARLHIDVAPMALEQLITDVELNLAAEGARPAACSSCCRPGLSA